jgi:hypothetical protein
MVRIQQYGARKRGSCVARAISPAQHLSETDPGLDVTRAFCHDGAPLSLGSGEVAAPREEPRQAALRRRHFGERKQLVQSLGLVETAGPRQCEGKQLDCLDVLGMGLDPPLVDANGVDDATGPGEHLRATQLPLAAARCSAHERVEGCEGGLEAPLLDKRARTIQLIGCAWVTLLLLCAGNRRCGDDEGEDCPTEILGHVYRRARQERVADRGWRVRPSLDESRQFSACLPQALACRRIV